MAKKDWKYGLCECCCQETCGLCCIAWIVPCFVFGENYRLLKDLNSNEKSFLDNCNGCCDCDDQTKSAWMYGIPWFSGIVGQTVSAFSTTAANPLLVLSTVSCLLQCQTRGSIRRVTGLDENCCNDCCVSYFCYPCALVQERQHLKSNAHDYAFGSHESLRSLQNSMH